MRGKFPQSCKHFNSPKNDLKSSLGYFSHNWDLSHVIKLQFKIFEGSTWEISRDSTGKGAEYIHIENTPSFPLHFRREIVRKFPQG